MDDPVCPVLSGYFRELRSELSKTPLLYETELEQLGELEDRMDAEGPHMRTRNVRNTRRGLCLQFTLIHFRLHYLTTIILPDEQARGGWLRGALKTLVQEGGPSGSQRLAEMARTISELVEDRLVEVGEMGLLGIRRDGQQLRYGQLEETIALGEACSKLASIVEQGCTTEDPEEELATAVDAGALLAGGFRYGNVPMERRVKYAERLLELTGFAEGLLEQ